MGNLKKHYIGSINSEEKAAKIYDRHAILTHGLRAKTNYSYTKAQIVTMLQNEFEDPVYTQEEKNMEESDSHRKESGQ